MTGPGRRPPPIHYLRRNDAVWTPPHLVFADTETRTVEEAGRQVQVLRCWAGRAVDRRPTSSGRLEDRAAAGDTAEELADAVEDWLVGRESLWVFFHNAGFDIAVTRLPMLLAARGWRITDVAADSASPWMRLARRGKRLAILDSWSWLRVPLSKVGAAVGITKPPLPADDDDAAAWRARCAADVDILTAGMTQLMNWWETTGKGRWSITGGATGWNAMRHTPTKHRVLVTPDEAGIAADRAAVHGGIRYVWRHGTLPEGSYTEVDIEQAYVTAAATQLLPVKRMRVFDSYPIDGRLLATNRFAAVARVLIETDSPDYPCRIGRHVWYPVGRFWTTLAGPDLAAAQAAGHLIACARTDVHQLGDALMPWATWCRTLAAGRDPDAPPVAVIAGKHWARAVLGKWAQRSFSRTELGPSPVPGWGYQHAYSHVTGTRGALLDVAGQRWFTFADGDADNCYPAIWAFAEAHVRAALRRVTASLSPDQVIQADTDGLIVDRLSEADLSAAQAAAAPFTIRAKRTFTRLEVIGPQHLIRDGRRKFSGVPAAAVKAKDGRYTAEFWPKLSTQMAIGSTTGFVNTTANILIRPTYAPGWVTDTGRVLPIETVVNPAGETQILPWTWTRHADAGMRLGPDQHQLLADHTGTAADAAAG